MDEIEFAGAQDLTPLKTQHPQKGIAFRNDETGQELIAVVHDKYPQLGDLNLEGRHYVEVSVELWVDIMATQGFHTIDPREIPAAAAEEITKDKENDDD